MNDITEQVSLPEKDYLEIISTIEALGLCETRSSLFETIKQRVFPLIGVQSCLMGFMDPDLPHARFFDIIFDSKLRKEPLTPENKMAMQSWIASAEVLRSQFFEKERSVLAFDVDIPKETMLKAREKFLESPNAKHYPKEFLPRTGFFAMDKPDNYLGMGFQRYEETPVTFREIRILELLRPHIIRVIKGIVTREELNKYKSVTEALANSPTAVALIDIRPWILYCNASFQKILNVREGELLPNEIAAFLREEISEFSPQDSTLDGSLKLSFFKINDQVFRLCLIPLGQKEDETGLRWLLKLKPPSEHAAKINLKMNQANLTPREMEIACLMLDDMEDQQISDRLFISVHTVRTHVKAIYKKFSVASRLELIRKLKN